MSAAAHYRSWSCLNKLNESSSIESIRSSEEERFLTPALTQSLSSDENSLEDPYLPNAASWRNKYHTKNKNKHAYRTPKTKKKKAAERRSTSPSLVMDAPTERNYWKTVVTSVAKAYGSDNVKTAEAVMNLANAHMKCKEYSQSLRLYKSALKIYYHVHGSIHLTVAKCLDKIGLCVARGGGECENNNLEQASEAIEKAFGIRYNLLGPHHVDTVDSLNNLAGLYSKSGKYKKAKQAYWQVWQIRRGMFGLYHPSVAVTAHALGAVHVRLGNIQKACEYYNEARNIYLNMGLDQDHVDVKRLLRDVISAERVLAISKLQTYGY